MGPGTGQSLVPLPSGPLGRASFLARLLSEPLSQGDSDPWVRRGSFNEDLGLFDRWQEPGSMLKGLGKGDRTFLLAVHLVLPCTELLALRGRLVDVVVVKLL